MSTSADPVQTFATAVSANLANVTTALTNIASGILALDALITSLQNSPGTLSAADQSALDSIQAASQALVTQVQAISTTPPGATPPIAPAAKKV